MPDNKKYIKINEGNKVVTTDGKITIVENSNYLIHSLQTDNSDFAPPPVSKLNGNGDSTSNNNNEDK